jgi:hypothetical protein
VNGPIKPGEGAFMALQSHTTNAPTAVPEPTEISEVYVQGVVAGLIGAATIALWFFIIDLYNGRPFYTPNVLGAALSLSGQVRDPTKVPISIESVIFYSWIHVLVFCVIGGLAAKLLSLAERDLHFGFGILLLFIIFEFGFVAAAMVFAEPILDALAWPAVLVGNLLAAAAMAVYFWRHHPKLQISP